MVHFDPPPRHVQQPGAVIFTTAGMAVELRQTGQAGAIGASRAALKHPKMQRTGNKEIVQRSEDNRSDGDVVELVDEADANGNDDGNTLPLSNAVSGLFGAPVDFEPATNMEEDRISGLLNGRQPQPQPQPAAGFGQRSRKVLDANEANAANAGDSYDSYFNFDQEGRIAQLAQRADGSPPFGGALTQRAIRSKTNRRIVGDGQATAAPSQRPAVDEQFDAIGQQPAALPEQSAETRPRDYGRVEPHRNTLWELEIEREMGEAKKAQRGADVDFQTKTGVRRRRRRQIGQQRQRRQSAVDFLPTVASTGVLVAPLPLLANATGGGPNGTANCSSVDLMFVLNVRESETMPPLLLPADMACVEEKLALEKATYGGEWLGIGTFVWIVFGLVWFLISK